MDPAQDSQDDLLARQAAFENVPYQLNLLKAVYDELYTSDSDSSQWSARLQQLKEKLRAQNNLPLPEPETGYPFLKDNADNERALYSAAIYKKMATAINQDVAAEKAAKNEQMNKE
ncbi:hypothetical protein TYRP_005520 [Tyrophagus putrescentiae]|nr:hypothetical protein TYRP_005520 [Tyrophagus putrescentiae]